MSQVLVMDCSNRLPERFEPVEILALVRASVMSWFTTVPELGASVPQA
jgi:hypothetical protein